MIDLQGALIKRLKELADKGGSAIFFGWEAQALLDERDALLKTDTRFNDLPKELVKDNGIEYIRIPYIAFAKWDMSRHTAIAKASV